MHRVKKIQKFLEKVKLIAILFFHECVGCDFIFTKYFVRFYAISPKPVVNEGCCMMVDFAMAALQNCVCISQYMCHIIICFTTSV